jgi:asparagine synthase (glutamine-hydrolysing)
MCGIAGIWRHDSAAADVSSLLAMLSAIVHRGPDDRGVWQDGGVALGQQRLTILDLSPRANQPMITPDGQGVLVYNGEVYNYKSLRRELEQQGVGFRTAGDTEVVLHALASWGPQRSIPRFNGMFAFAYFDRREHALWLARDRLGIKPLAVHRSDDRIIFASEAKALLAHGGVPRRIDMGAVTAWLLARSPIPPRAFIEGIDGLEAGTWWKISKQGIERQRYFHALDDLDLGRLIAAGEKNPADLVKDFSEAMRESVGIHLASDVPVAAMCSGGVDSSLIAAHAKSFNPGIQAYVADVIGDESEAPQARRVAKHLGIDIHSVPVARENFLRLWPHCIWHSDGPISRPSDPALLAITQRCRADGVKVLLTGEGSDELFGGYDWHGDTFSHWRRLHSRWRRFYRKFFRKTDLQQLRYAPFSGLRSRRDYEFRRLLMIAVEPDIQSLPPRFINHLEAIDPPEDRALLAQCLYDLYDNLPSLLHRHDRMGMAASLEMRVPFIENKVIDIACHLPRAAKLQGSVGKWVVKMAASEFLPRDVVYAPKKGFPMPASFTRGCERLLKGGLLPEQMHWSAATLDDVLTLANEDTAFRFWVTSLEIWMRQFCRGDASDQLGERLLEVAS